MHDHRGEIERKRLAMGLLPTGWRAPIYMEDFLVEVWRLYSVGRDDDARNLLAREWSWGTGLSCVAAPGRI